MPTPGYIICAKSGAVDKFTERISCFDILSFIALDANNGINDGYSNPVSPLKFWATAAWVVEPTDSPTALYESSFFLRFNDQPEVELEKKFEIYLSSRLVHINVPVFTVNGVDGPGILQVISKIRLQGSSEWLGEQSFRIVLEQWPKPPA